MVPDRTTREEILGEAARLKEELEKMPRTEVLTEFGRILDQPEEDPRLDWFDDYRPTLSDLEEYQEWLYTLPAEPKLDCDPLTCPVCVQEAGEEADLLFEQDAVIPDDAPF